MARFLLLATCCGLVNAVFFYVTEGQQRCFMEEVPSETLVVGSYRSPDIFASTPGQAPVGLRVTVRDPVGAQVLQKNLDNEGRFAYTSALGGEFSICFHSNSSRWFGQPRKFRVDLSLEVGEGALNYEEIAKKEHLTELETEIRRLTDKARDIVREQAYQREREIQFRKTSETTAGRLQYWSAFQSFVVLSSAAFTVMHLKQYFIRKKVL